MSEVEYHRGPVDSIEIEPAWIVSGVIAERGEALGNLIRLDAGAEGRPDRGHGVLNHVTGPTAECDRNAIDRKTCDLIVSARDDDGVINLRYYGATSFPMLRQQGAVWVPGEECARRGDRFRHAHDERIISVDDD